MTLRILVNDFLKAVFAAKYNFFQSYLFNKQRVRYEKNNAIIALAAICFASTTSAYLVGKVLQDTVTNTKVKKNLLRTHVLYTIFYNFLFITRTDITE